MTTAISSTTSAKTQSTLGWALLGIGIVVSVAAIVFGYNLYGFPLYVNDEGIYMAKAYAVLNNGWLTPYTYWYDHAPAGWLLIALWGALTGGFDTFGPAINSGRVLMLVLHVVSVGLIFQIVYRQTADSFAATAAGLLYALSPLVLLHGRTVRLDNMMVFWALLATALILNYSGKLWPVIWSGLLFGVATLTKENAVLLMPAFIFLLWTTMRKSHARFARAGWLFGAIAVISLYPLYASLREELFSFDLSSPISGEGGSVSLIGTLMWQMSRSGGMPWDPSSEFYRALTTDWLFNDPWFLAIGVVAVLWNLITGDVRRRAVALMAVLSILGLARGSQVIDFYILAVLPFFALNFGLAVADLTQRSTAQMLSSTAVVAVVALGWINLDKQNHLFSTDINQIQEDAIAWLQQHATPDSQIVVSDELWVDLRDGTTERPGLLGTHSHWQVALDEAVSKGLFHEDWKFIDYLVVSPEMQHTLATYPDKLPNQAYENSTVVAEFSYGDAAVEIRKVNHAGLSVKEMLTYSYEGFKERYLDHGQFRTKGGYTDARNQAGAMLMAVWMDDQTTFNEVWSWTAMNLQSPSGLLYQSNEPGAIQYTNTDADTDLALALLLAEKKWGDSSYGRHAEPILDALWDTVVVEVRGKPYLAAGDWAVTRNEVIFAPSTFIPYAYHFFAEADPDRDWWHLLDVNYALLSEVSSQSNVGLPPAFVAINRWTGLTSTDIDDLPERADLFTDHAAQVFWRVGLDAQWHDDTRADDYLAMSDFLLETWKVEEQLASAYTLSGQSYTKDESTLMYSAVLPKLLAQDPASAHELYGTKLVPLYQQDKGVAGQWGDNPTVAQERWAWLATGIYGNFLQYQEY